MIKTLCQRELLLGRELEGFVGELLEQHCALCPQSPYSFRLYYSLCTVSHHSRSEFPTVFVQLLVVCSLGDSCIPLVIKVGQLCGLMTGTSAPFSQGWGSSVVSKQSTLFSLLFVVEDVACNTLSVMCKSAVVSMLKCHRKRVEAILCVLCSQQSAVLVCT